ncbi:hypothetical protein FB451DRAFT_1460727 [Mycena latifolia]|nr:hypothetical protein FB451DRAFT_1460727 [Mycena latifolia]
MCQPGAPSFRYSLFGILLPERVNTGLQFEQGASPVFLPSDIRMPTQGSREPGIMSNPFPVRGSSGHINRVEHVLNQAPKNPVPLPHKPSATMKVASVKLDNHGLVDLTVSPPIGTSNPVDKVATGGTTSIPETAAAVAFRAGSPATTVLSVYNHSDQDVVDITPGATVKGTGPGEITCEEVELVDCMTGCVHEETQGEVGLKQLHTDDDSDACDDEHESLVERRRGVKQRRESDNNRMLRPDAPYTFTVVCALDAGSMRRLAYIFLMQVALVLFALSSCRFPADFIYADLVHFHSRRP